MDNTIVENISNPHELERIYREDPEEFAKAFQLAWEQNPDSQVLAVWQERLNFKEAPGANRAPLLHRDFLFMGILAILAGISTRIIMHFAEMNAIAPVNLAFGVFSCIAAYFVYSTAPKKNVVITLAAVFLTLVFYVNLLPLELSDSIIMAYLHLPVLLWVLLGLAFTGDEYGLGKARLAYLRFNGEFCIVYASMAISGMLLTGLTMQLFSFVGMDISEFYFENVVLVGAASLSVVAAYLVSKNLKFAKSIAPYIAKIFSPLVLLTLLAYLATVVMVGKNPFLDRDFLIAFNGVLLAVLAVTIFSISGSEGDDKKKISDYINFALILLALMIDSVALSAMVFRLSSYGITPNRVAVLGMNILVWANLLWIMVSYARFFQGKNGILNVQDSITRYLSVYGLWAAIVTFAFPLIFKWN